MAEYTVRVRRYKPEEGSGPYWQDFDVELDPTLSVLDGLLQARDRDDGSLSVRCSCRAAICGSCGVKINGQSTLACLTQIGEAAEAANRRNGAGNRDAPGREAEEASRPILVEPMGNMPVIKDLIVDMEATHWEKIRRVTPWLLPEGEPPEREYIVPPESMIDITQSMACIQCGACVSSCLSMEADPDFIGPAALAKAYRFVGDPRDGQTRERLYDLAQDPHGIYDCTHCFSCVDACPKGVAPMDQIMRLRRKAGDDEEIDDVNNGRRHELAFTKIIEKKGTLDESLLLQESYAQGIKGKLKPSMGAITGLIGSIPTAIRGIRTGKMRSLPKLIPGIHPKLPDGAQDQVKRIYEHAEKHELELNLYIQGEEDVEPEPDEETAGELQAEGEAAEPGAEGAGEQWERQTEQEGDAAPSDDQQGGAATPTEASAVGGGRQHMDKVTEGGTTAASGETSGSEAEVADHDDGADAGAGAGEELAGSGDSDAGEAEGEVGAEDEEKPGEAGEGTEDEEGSQ
jgi:succinate dehydrogenase / fumarate reductase, iron-sulfur subunit